jgi:thiamine kinase-like enzyme
VETGAAKEMNVTAADVASIGALLPTIPQLRGQDLETLTIERLTSLTNKNYRIGVAGEDYVLRVPGETTNTYINRKHEIAHAKRAAELGLAPDVAWADATSGVSLSRFIPSGKALTAQRLVQPDMLRKVANVLGVLHRSSTPLQATLDPIVLFDQYMALAVGADGLEDELKWLADAIEPHRVTGTDPRDTCPCHIDPNPSNFVDDGERLWLVDWEFSANAPPMWDLACLSLESSMNDELCNLLLANYGATSDESGTSLFEHRALVGLVSLAWTAGQIPHANDSADFLADFRARFEGMANGAQTI